MDRNRIVKEMEELEKPDTFGSDAEDEDEQADEAEDLATRLSIRDAKKAQLEEIEKALQKIEDGIYGVCEQCGKKISATVLNAAPESALCEECKRAA